MDSERSRPTPPSAYEASYTAETDPYRRLSTGMAERREMQRNSCNAEWERKAIARLAAQRRRDASDEEIL